MMPDWYDIIEEPVREVVRLLRNNGFNTTCSCGHEMYVEMECHDDREVTYMYNLLVENGYTGFTIMLHCTHRSGCYIARFMLLELEKGTVAPCPV